MFIEIQTWISDHRTLVSVLSTLSIIGILASLFFAPLIVAQIPADYFSSNKRVSPVKQNHLAWYCLIFVVKNLFGVALTIMGLIMLVTPGPGFVFLTIGLILTNYPGKYRLERWLVRRPSVLSSLNWMRKKKGKPPLIL